MGIPGDKEWAPKPCLDPLTAAEETAPGSHFTEMDGNTRGIYPRPLTSASQSQSTFHLNTLYSSPHQKGVFEGCEDAVGMQQSSDPFMDQEKRPTTQRDCFLGERFPGDMSHRPLELLRKQTKAADRSSHLKKKHIPDTDLVDSLDNTVMGMVYHHGGPYDATLLARNTDYLSSPVAAVSETNAEALKATPKECIRDSLRNHVPLQGTAVIPPGTRDFSGCEMRYEEGSDLMREDGEGGAYKRWPGIKYHPDDLKGKGEPYFTIERALKEHKNSLHSTGEP